MKLASLTAVLHSAGIPGVLRDVSADRDTWHSEASLLTAQEQLHTPEEQSPSSESRTACSSSPKRVPVSHRAVVSLQEVVFTPLCPSSGSCSQLTQ